MIMKFQFFNHQYHKDFDYTVNTKNNRITFCEVEHNKKDNKEFLSKLNILSMQCVNKQIFLLCKKPKEETNKELFEESIKNQQKSSTLQSLEYVILKICNNKVLDEYLIFNRIIYSFKIIKKSASINFNISSTNTFEGNQNLEKFFFLVTGSDYIENKSSKEKKIELNILSSVYIIDGTPLIDPNNKFSSNHRNIDQLIVKKISLIEQPNSQLLYTGSNLPKNFSCLDNINCFSVNSELSLMALGLENGNITLIYPSEFPLNYNPNKNNMDISSRMNSSVTPSKQNSKHSLPDQQFSAGLPLSGPRKKEISVLFDKSDLIKAQSISAVIFTDSSESGLPINSLEFANLKSKRGEFEVIYVSTFHSIMCYSIDKTGFKVNFKTINTTIGTFPNGLLRNTKNQIISCTKENYILEYINLEKGATWLFEGKIQNPVITKNNIAFILYESTSPILAIYDLKNKIFAYYNNIFFKIYQITLDLHDLSFVVLIENEHGNKQFISLHEKENSYKFQIFYKKHLYDLAFDYARNLRYNQNQISEIHMSYGDHLYSLGEYYKSVEEYSKTISYIHPSYIIAKFLESSKIEYLILYLEALHLDNDFKKRMGSDMTNFTKLLLSIYTKHKKFKKLQQFVEHLNFKDYNLTTEDVEGIVDVCLALDQEDIALMIAKKSNNKYKVLDILIVKKSK